MRTLRHVTADYSNQRVPMDAPSLLAEAAIDLREGRTRMAHATVRRALDLAGRDGDVHAEAARLLADLGEHEEAVAAVLRAVAFDPDHVGGVAAMRRFGLVPVELPALDGAAAALGATMPRTGTFELARAARALGTDGIVVLPRFASAAECEALRERDDADPCFVLAQDLATEQGTAARAVLREPLASDLRLLVGEAYARAAELANDLGAKLHETARVKTRELERFPIVEPPPMLPWDRAVRLRLGDGSSHARRRDAGDRHSFSVRAVLPLGPAPIEVVLHDLRPGKARARRVQVAAGALVLHCARERPVVIGGVLGLQPIEWELLGPEAGVASALLLAWPYAVSAPA